MPFLWSNPVGGTRTREKSFGPKMNEAMFVATLVNSIVGMNELKVASLMERPSSAVG